MHVKRKLGTEVLSDVSRIGHLASCSDSSKRALGDCRGEAITRECSVLAGAPHMEALFVRSSPNSVYSDLGIDWAQKGVSACWWAECLV